MLALYVVSLCASAGIAGVFGHRLMAELGYVPGFVGGAALTGALACGYGAIQLLYMAGVRLLAPTQSRGPLITEFFSHLAVLVFVPFLIRVDVAWPHPLFARLEPLVYLAGFGAIHGLFKLATFYAALRGEPSGRLGALGWLAGAIAAVAAGYAGFAHWVEALDEARPRAAEAVNRYRVGGAYASARSLPEGAVLTVDLAGFPGECLTFRWAQAPAAAAAEDEDLPLSRVYAHVEWEESDKPAYTTSVRLDDSGWSEMVVPADSIPEGARRCRVTWRGRRSPRWRRLMGLRPLVQSSRRILLSGPFEHESRTATTQPNIVVVVLEGLARSHVSCMGYDRTTTPHLDRLARSAQTFSNAYTPAPEGLAAAVSVLTGLNPIHHSFLGGNMGPLPRSVQTVAQVLADKRYATGCFLELAEGPAGDALVGTGIDSGFELFAASQVADSTGGSRAVVDEARRWVRSHADRKFFLFVHLAELADPVLQERYRPGFLEQEGKTTAVDVYDSAIKYTDNLLGELIGELLDSGVQEQTCLLATSAYGLDFVSSGDGLPVVGLREESLHVPLFVYVPWESPGDRSEVVGLEDVAPTVLDMANAAHGGPTDGLSLLDEAHRRRPVAVFGDPLALSIRTDRWRYTWQSGLSPFNFERRGRAGAIGLYDLDADTEEERRTNLLGQYPRLEERLRDELAEFLELVFDDT